MKRYEEIKNIEYLSIPMFALLFAILPLPYVYYSLLRVLITGFALYCVYLEVNEKHHDEKNKWLLLFGLLAIIYNPIVPVHLTKLLWVIINLGSFLVFVSYKGHVEEFISNSTVQSERKENVRDQEYFEKKIEARLDHIEAVRDYIEALAEKENEKEARLEDEISKVLITSGLNRDDVSTEPSTLCECDDCSAEVELWEAMPIINPHHKIHMADVVPAGQCPECQDGFLYLLEADADNQNKSIRSTEPSKRREEVPLHYSGMEAWPFWILVFGFACAFVKVLFL